MNLVNGNAFQIPLKPKSVHTCITSPPYYSLRKYSGEQEFVFGGDKDCEHKFKSHERYHGSPVGNSKTRWQHTDGGSPKTHPEQYEVGAAGTKRVSTTAFCHKCNAWRGAYGLEPTLQMYIDHTVEWCREVKRVLRDDGTFWLNIGDSYAGGGRGGQSEEKLSENWQPDYPESKVPDNLKPKDLMGVPWRVALALQADGWVLRSEVIWAKPNPMPESVTDRPTKSHEQLFLFSKATWTGDYPQRRLREVDARWLALLIETEGSAIVRRYIQNRITPQHTAAVSVANSDLSILQEAKRIAGCGSILRRDGTNKDIYYLQWTTKEAATILWEVYPYLFGKQRQALIAITLEARRSNKNKGKRKDIFRKEGRHYYLTDKEIELRDRMWKANKALNQGQEVDLSWLPKINLGKWSTNKYYYDADAIREEAINEGKIITVGPNSRADVDRVPAKNLKQDMVGDRRYTGFNERWSNRPVSGRNKRTVWKIATAPYSGAHFATYPPALVEPCIKAGTSEYGVCPECGNGWERVVEKNIVPGPKAAKTFVYDERDVEGHITNDQGSNRQRDGHTPGYITAVETLGWQPTCTHDLEPVPATVCDVFSGSGTTLLVARKLGRKGIGLDLSADYIELAKERLGLKALEEWENGKDGTTDLEGLPMFEEVASG